LSPCSLAEAEITGALRSWMVWMISVLSIPRGHRRDPEVGMLDTPGDMPEAPVDPRVAPGKLAAKRIADGAATMLGVRLC